MSMSNFLLLLLSLLLLLPRTRSRSRTIHNINNVGEEGSSSNYSQWQLLQKSIGISAMHMQLLNDDRVVILDRTDFGPSNISLPNGKCRKDPHDLALKIDCTAHSVEYNSLSNTFRPLSVLTDTWCSSGATLPNGTLIHTGGYNDGESSVRVFQPSCQPCDWVELPEKLLSRRWYATNHILPDGRLIVIGGRRAFNYEFYPKSSSKLVHKLPFLAETNDPRVENNLYPFVFLHLDGNLFIFANNRAILLDYTKHVVVRTYPTIPGGEPRSYPSSGSAVLLPLKNFEMGLLNMEVEVLICGGASPGSYLKALMYQFLPALNTCARINLNDPNPTWAIETMPMPRVMSDMVILPNEDILLINGARSGCSGWELGRHPILSPVIYHPNNNTLGQRFETQNQTQIPRMYHSTAILLRDGRVLVGGSNPHMVDRFTNVLYPTELSLEAFTPPYLNPAKTELRPVIVTPVSSKIQYKDHLEVKFSINGSIELASIKVTMVRPPFNTHSISMSQRLLVLTNKIPVAKTGFNQYQVNVTTPESAIIAPPGFYMLFVVHQNIPSVGIWIQLLLHS